MTEESTGSPTAMVGRAIQHLEDNDMPLAAQAVRELESMYGKIIREILLCDPIPASQRADDQLEPPWEVIARMRKERCEAERDGYANGYATAIETAAQFVENVDGYTTIHDLPHRIRSLHAPT